MKITKFWVVRDPNVQTLSTDEICCEMTTREFMYYTLGAGVDAAKRGDHTLYASKSEAMEDAETRMGSRNSGVNDRK